MKPNEGAVDRIIRVVVGLFVLSLIFWGPKSLWGLLGLIPLLTGLTGFCGLYSLLHMATLKKKQPPTAPQQ